MFIWERSHETFILPDMTLSFAEFSLFYSSIAWNVAQDNVVCCDVKVFYTIMNAEFYDTDYFITLIEARPAIWNKALPEYKDRVKTRNAWVEVCDLLNGDYKSWDSKKQKEFRK